jgi:hypothetical protein
MIQPLHNRFGSSRLPCLYSLGPRLSAVISCRRRLSQVDARYDPTVSTTDRLPFTYTHPAVARFLSCNFLTHNLTHSPAKLLFELLLPCVAGGGPV